MQNLPTNQKEQLTWVLTETARQLLHALKWPARAWHAYGVELRRRQALDRQLERLTNPFLLSDIESGIVRTTQDAFFSKPAHEVIEQILQATPLFPAINERARAGEVIEVPRVGEYRWGDVLAPKRKSIDGIFRAV